MRRLHHFLLLFTCISLLSYAHTKFVRESAKKSAVEHRYLITFNTRLFQAQQAEFLRNVSSTAGIWPRYIYRSNPASKLPSQHAVIKSSVGLEKVRDWLAQFPEIAH